MSGDLENVDGGGSVSTPPAAPEGGPSDAPERARDEARLDRWIHRLENLVRIPGTRLTFGLDVILGLLPVVGDFAGLACGVPLVVVAVKRRLPFAVVLVMAANLLLDAVVGSVPLLGNLFDLFWKAHSKNLLLLRQPAEVGAVLREARWKVAVVAVAVAVLAAALVFLLLLSIWLVVWLYHGFW